MKTSFRGISWNNAKRCKRSKNKEGKRIIFVDMGS